MSKDTNPAMQSGAATTETPPSRPESQQGTDKDIAIAMSETSATDKPAEGDLQPLSEQEKQEYEKCIENIRTNLTGNIQAGGDLKKVRDGKLYRDEFDTFEEFCLETFNIGRSYAHRLIEAWENREDLLPIGNVVPLPTSEAQLRELTGLDTAIKKQRAWKQAQKLAGNTAPTAEEVKQAVDQIKGIKTVTAKAKRAKAVASLRKVEGWLKELREGVLKLPKSTKLLKLVEKIEAAVSKNWKA